VPTLWGDLGIIGAVLVLIGCQFYWFRGSKGPVHNLGRRIDSLLEGLEKDSGPESDGWRAEIERRMTILEGDVVRHLQKINQRAQQAERAERRRRGEADDDPEEPDQTDLDQLQLALGGNGVTSGSTPEEVSLDAVRAAMRGR